MDDDDDDDDNDNDNKNDQLRCVDTLNHCYPTAIVHFSFPLIHSQISH